MTHSLLIIAIIATALASEGHLPATELPVLKSVESFRLDLPARCQLGDTCWVANYVDVDPGSTAKDFRCEARTYDGHDGIDLAIRDRGVMEQGIAVLAVAPGTVRRMRDGVADVGLSDEASRATVAGRECGNGIVIDHGNGWETQYCHLKQYSVRVTMGQRVKRGEQLGLIGLSGKTEFPHLHLTVRHQGTVIDPFTGRAKDAGCGRPGDALWRDQGVTYEAVALYHAGFSGAEPNADAIRRGQSDSTQLSADVPALVLWVDIFGVKSDDRLRFRIAAPDGRIILDREQRIDRTQARRFAFAGLRHQSPAWPPGLYKGEIVLQRGQGSDSFARTRHVVVELS